MLCDLCHKEEAIIHWTVLINNQKTDLHLCENCAVKRGLIAPGGMKFKELLPLIPKTPEVEAIRCRNCGLSAAEFRDTARLGCPQCYEDFKKILIPILRHIHGSAEHLGKTIQIKGESKVGKLTDLPAKTKLPPESDKRYEMLKEQLKTAVANESYEKAARLRDELKKLEDGE